MRARKRRACVAAATLMLAVAPLIGTAQRPAIDVAPIRDLAWRNLGPFRGGRTTVVAGVASAPHLFFAGAATGGVWKSSDAGRVWVPVFDAESTTSIGALAIAPSDPQVVYVGSGAEARDPEDSVPPGDGLYRSDDGGSTWTNIGLPDSHQIAAIAVHPRDAGYVLVAVQGHAFGSNLERGVFRSTDTGRTLERVLFVNDDTGASDVMFDPQDPETVYATLQERRRTPGNAVQFGPATGAYKSTDGGSTWTRVGPDLSLPDGAIRRIDIAVAPSDRRRLVVLVDAGRDSGLYTSRDAGESWTLVNGSVTTPARIAIDPADPDIVYVTGSAASRSDDGGRTFAEWRRDPGGAGYGQLWINPADAGIAALAGDRGAIVTLNGGQSWSSSLNQPTGSFRQVGIDSDFPYRVCGAERGGPPGCVPSRSRSARIAAAEWQFVGDVVGASVAPDPSDADVVYSGTVVRFDRSTGQLRDVGPPEVGQRGQSLLRFDPTDARTLYLATDILWRTTTGGQSWTAVSPVLTRGSIGGPEAAPDNAAGGAGVSALDPSPVDGRTIWVGTDDGLVHVTRDGGASWASAAVPDLDRFDVVTSIAASHFDTNTAYAAASGRRRGDMRPRLWRTRDGGEGWVDIARGLDAAGIVHAVVEDPARRGLLFAATDRGVFVSFDDGDQWQSLRLNLPAVPVRGLVVHESDLVVATHGRGFWVLDDISVLRQITADVARADAYLFRPAVAWRSSEASDATMALATDEPAAENPPAGVALSYLIGTGAEHVTLEIIETLSDDLIRRYSSDSGDRSSSSLSSSPGVHRVVWDLQRTPVDGRGVRVLPGTYQVRLTVDGKPLRQAVVVRLDPRVRASTTDLTAQHDLARELNNSRHAVSEALNREDADRPLSAATRGRLRDVMASLTAVLDRIQRSDARPTPVTEEAAAQAIAEAGLALGIVASEPAR